MISIYLREHESITVKPIRILRVELHELVEENVGYRCHAHRRTGMAGVRLEGGIDLVWNVSEIVSLSTKGESEGGADFGCNRGRIITARSRMVLIHNSSDLS